MELVKGAQACFRCLCTVVLRDDQDMAAQTLQHTFSPAAEDCAPSPEPEQPVLGKGQGDTGISGSSQLQIWSHHSAASLPSPDLCWLHSASEAARTASAGAGGRGPHFPEDQKFL